MVVTKKYNKFKAFWLKFYKHDKQKCVLHICITLASNDTLSFSDSCINSPIILQI